MLNNLFVSEKLKNTYKNKKVNILIFGQYDIELFNSHEINFNVLENITNSSINLIYVIDKNTEYKKYIPFSDFILFEKETVLEEYYNYESLNSNFYKNAIENKIVFDRINLTFNEQTYIRGKPREYILHTCKLLTRYTKRNIIVEIGSIRNKMQHDIHTFNPVCCNDGHSTYFWNFFTTIQKIITVDINPKSKKIINNDKSLGDNVEAITSDAIDFLRNYNGEKIDLLFLDAWDVEPGSPYEEKHLEAYLTIKDKLADTCLILIDDTDICDGGKGKMVIPELLKDGFIHILSGRQTLFLKI